MPTSHAGLSGAVALSILAAVSLERGAARSQSFVIGNGVTAGQQTMTGAGDTGAVSATGAIETSGAGIDAVRMFGPAQRFNNHGLVETSGGAINVNSQAWTRRFSTTGPSWR
ncbi:MULTISPECIES: hypothetical protein [unclassified Mesorhizobium]|uniref:hypothetical protein n=1 Tax=unclassified Mesorhizobium TaxID=325217 RepID=UPI000FCC0C76|nr:MULTISPECIES: hypothetical protein [unclassified Mesorhizobium]TGP19072.1 hypothetical protein EN874_027755 [Mesorhizobium sp. M1D.F.Ca.ET.231.01.1.1]TGP25698.1 hypothetical protein EN877_27875 [Mesorhizobium sp. M1D.F.Ca.ET.234.01.1.1]TGS40509.1 hypothetical protein EN827_26125 [Mesorhizobium sp. M1D.F.Ca.ET.184.01.1.1]TGS58954.1 hypothetical protein EN826_026125 [Mesorhizobium sp. M1D.F.Ca.ET.183.01.1.1]